MPSGLPTGKDNGDDGRRSHPFGLLLAVSHRVFELSDASGDAAAQARESVVGFEPALLKGAENFSLRSCIRRPRAACWAGKVPPHAAHCRFAGVVVRPQPTIRERKEPSPLHFQSIAHWGAWGKTRVKPPKRRPRPEPGGKWE